MIKHIGNLDIDANGIEYNSKKVTKGSIFVAIKGFKTDGTEYINEAVENGAIGVIVEDKTVKESKPAQYLMLDKKGIVTTAITVEDSRKALASLSADFYDHPSQELNVIGITGTNGKTTITYLLESILQSAGKQTGVIGTINYRFGKKVVPAMQTTPESLDLQKMFREMADNKITDCILEVSSHSLSLNRVYKTKFAVGIFTNLTQDHLDFHQTKENYFKTKEKLFTEYDLKKAVINIDDPYGKLIAEKTGAEKIRISIKEEGDIRAKDIDMSIDGTSFTVKTPKGELQITSDLIGSYNIYNILCAIGAAIASDLPLEEIEKGINSLKCVPGRFQRIDEGQDFTVVVDYAHTDDALKNVVTAARELTDKRIITVFGCGGNRDRDKRQKMGEVVGRHSDYTIITSDNPRNEEPASIIAEIELGVKKVVDSDKYCMEIERQEAIAKAISMAEKEDIVIIAGKGHENYQQFKERRIHFDDCEVAQELIKERLK